MPNHDLDSATKPRRRLNGAGLWVFALVLGATFATIGRPQAGPSTPIVTQAREAKEALPASSETTSSIGALTMPIRTAAPQAMPRDQSSLSPGQRHILILLLLICFAMLSFGGSVLWRRSFAGTGKPDPAPPGRR